jgi:asparagine synthase (glutamine-hydrolysing)
MCGICGTLGYNDPGLLKRMCDVMPHRGPDEEGYFTEENIGLGIRRLKIIDLATGSQPIHNEDKSLWVVLNGEVYNFKQLRGELIRKGHVFYTQSDTEVIVHLYEEYKEDCVSRLDGMFSFALWDKAQQKLVIARDRVGVKPFYYAQQNNTLIFASELKALLECPALSRQIDPQAVDYFMSFLYIPAPYSIFKGIKKLLAGHMLVCQGRQIEIKKYWDLAIVKQTGKPESFYAESLRSGLEDAVKSRLISDVPLGVFLSSGMDSSTIVALIAKLTGQKVKTFTIGYSPEHSSFNELEPSRAVARYFGTEHHEFIVQPDILDILPKLVWHMDEPFADSSAIPTFLVSQLARQHITVALSGIGGDELFAGYPRYLGASIAGYYQRLPMALRRLFAGVLSGLPESTGSANTSGRLKRFSRGALMPLDRMYLSWVSVMSGEQKDNLYSRQFQEELKGRSPTAIHLDYLNSVNTADFLDRALYLDTKTYLTDDLLFMGDKMSMAHSLELREPLCDHRLLELSASIPYGLKIKGFNLKYLMKEAVKDILPAQVLKAGKHGFMIPIGSWLKKELKPLTMELLSEPNIKRRGYFNYERVRGLLDRHYQGKQNLDDLIWALLILEIWHQVYIDKKM